MDKNVHELLEDLGLLTTTTSGLTAGGVAMVKRPSRFLRNLSPKQDKICWKNFHQQLKYILPLLN
jgi:hypothetical protein